MKKFVIVFISFFFFFISPIFAANFEIEKYYINIKVNEDKTMDIEEKIDVHFFVPQHGIFRDIPTSGIFVRPNGKDIKYRAKVSNIEVNKIYKESYTNSFLKLKIGSPNFLAKENETYVIRYKYNMGKDKVDDADEFYFNIIGDAWQGDIKKVIYKITMPKEFDKEQVYFYAEEEPLKNHCRINGNTIFGMYYGKLPAYSPLTIKIDLPDEYFISPPYKVGSEVFLLLIPLFLLLFSAILWFIYGRDDKPIEVVNFEPPEKMNPLEIAYIYTQKLAPKDLSALLFYLASKGYISIIKKEQDEEDTLLKKFDIEDIFFERVKDYDGYNAIEWEFLNIIFSNKKKISLTSLASSVELPKLAEKFTKKIEDGNIFFEKKSLFFQKLVAGLMIFSFFIINLIFSIKVDVTMIVIHLTLFPLMGYSMTIRQLYQYFLKGQDINKSEMFFGIFMSLYCLLFFSIFFISRYNVSPESYMFYFFGILCIFLTHIFQILMPKWTYKGNSVYGRVLGFRRFLKKVKIAEMKHHINENPEYFYQILPYALALGFSEKWIKRYIVFNEAAPSYYSGDAEFKASIFAKSISSTHHSITKCFTPLNNGSSSSGSGGGCSGGGGGGGGGGSW